MKPAQFAALLGAIAAAGCASRPAYAPPASGETATLRIVTSATQIRNLWVSYYPGQPAGHKCSASPPRVIAILNNASIQADFADGGRNTNAVEIAIPADGSEFRFGVPLSYAKSAEMFGLRNFNQTIEVKYERCVAHVGFVPRPGRTYFADHRMDSQGCGIALSRLEGAGARAVEPARSYEECWDETVLPNGERFFAK